MANPDEGIVEVPDTAEPEATALPSPGQMVREARERAGLALEDVGAQLKLSRSTLDAIERDDYSVLTESVYVRGYFRKLAKLLNMDDEVLLAGYDALARPASERTPQRIPLASGVAAGTSRHYRGREIGLLVAVVGILALLYFVAGPNGPMPLALPEVETVVVAPPPISAPLQLEPQPVAESDGADDAVPAVAEAPPQPVAAEVPKPPVAKAVVPAATEIPAATAVPGELVLEFRSASFVRIEDARSRTLLVGLVRAGEKEVLNSAAPYTVFLGNGRNVDVQFNGQPFDFSASIDRENDTARFTVP